MASLFFLFQLSELPVELSIRLDWICFMFTMVCECETNKVPASGLLMLIDRFQDLEEGSDTYTWP